MSLPSIEYILLAQQSKRRDSFTGAHMDINHLLTNRNPAGFGRNMQMQYELAPPQVAMSAGNYAQNLYVPTNNRIKSEGTGSDRGASPHISDHSRYSSQTPQQNPTFQQIAALSNFPNQMQQHPQQQQPQQQTNGVSMLQHAFQPTAVQEQYQQQQQQQAMSMGSAPPPDEGGSGRNSTGSGTGLPKAFACSTCSKGFARRSDLARHERIHSGVRPHVCEHPGCGKQFIQRSALTVHSRVHTGEKPHMCERCGKPFSDSSSLARHRRIHSGKRPYKCPYADCQKTFTRRTTLTRHQNHHTGTIEEAEAATAAALASRASVHNPRSRASDEENDFSGDAKSPMPQPDRQASASPAAGMNGVPMQQRQSSDYYMSAMNPAAMVHAQMRNGLQPSPRPQSPAHTQYPMQSNSSQGRPSLTSNPSSGYNPPQILEPPATNGQQQNGSVHNSPHMNGGLGGWQSPHNGIHAPQTTEYTYPTDVNNGAYTTAPALYYQPAGVQRPHSTGPLDHYNQLRGPEMWAQQQQ